MNYRLIVALSFFGLAMGIATVYVIPSSIEPFCWLAIFVVCAVIIARKAPGKPFWHGLLVSLVNSFWITSAHVLLFDAYIAGHPREAGMMAGSPLPPRLMMLLTGPAIGLISGVVLGLFALIAARIVKRSPSSDAPA